MTVPYVVGALLAGAFIGFVVTPWLIARQRREKLGQQVYEDAPKTHAVKSGTPTLGGLIFALAAVAGFLLDPDKSQRNVALLLLILSCSAVGFADDMLILRARRALGLRARAKFTLIAILAIAYVWYLGTTDPNSNVEAWFGAAVTLPRALWFVMSVLAIVGAANAVNLTDGLDGLAVGTVIPTLLVLQLPWQRHTISAQSGISLAVFGACVAFLWFNRHPARIFMGDTGSLALGALIAAIAVADHLLLFLPLLGLIFVIEALSVMLQVASFKGTGKRIFRMSPLHHHFELSGWRETSVTSVFIALQTLFAAATWALSYV